MAVPAGKASHMIVAVIATITFLTASTVLGATPIIISAFELKAAYEANKREANRTYKGEPLVVFGYLAEVDGKTVRFRSDTTCRMDSRRAAREMGRLSLSRYIVMAGTGDGHKSREPKVDDCRRLRHGDEHYVSVRGDVGVAPARVRRPTRVPTVTEWYEGGTLQRATALEWNRATHRNRMASAADWASAVLLSIDQPVNMDGLRLYADSLVRCVNEAVRDGPDSLQLTQVAAICWQFTFPSLSE